MLCFPLIVLQVIPKSFRTFGCYLFHLLLLDVMPGVQIKGLDLTVPKA